MESEFAGPGNGCPTLATTRSKLSTPTYSTFRARDSKNVNLQTLYNCHLYVSERAFAESYTIQSHGVKINGIKIRHASVEFQSDIENFEAIEKRRIGFKQSSNGRFVHLHF
jgi:hypothetical protein